MLGRDMSSVDSGASNGGNGGSTSDKPVVAESPLLMSLSVFSRYGWH